MQTRGKLIEEGEEAFVLREESHGRWRIEV
jgi:hypothetical protein